MHYYEVAPNRIIRQGASVFTYASESPLAIGQIVVVEIGRKEHVGIIMSETSEPTYATKPIIRTIEDRPIPLGLITLAWWLSSYYGSPVANVLQTMLPSGITKKRRVRSIQQMSHIRNRTQIVLNDDQVKALSAIESAKPGTILIHGVTGSGKTAVYIEATKRTLTAGHSVILLVPEIALTSQLVDEFSHHFEEIILTHSRQTEAERHDAWRRAFAASKPTIVIGPRSALFMPIDKLGLIIIDEAHEPSFKQEQSPRYSALRAASVLAATTQGKVILGSATPLINDYYLAKATNSTLIELPRRAVSDAKAPVIELVDMTKRNNFTKHRFLSNQLIRAVTNATENGNQALLFHNRRGSATTTLCENCGWSASCPRCFLPLTLHADSHILRCHTCGRTESIPTSCPVCKSVDIIHKGIGTKLIETELRRLFPNKVIARFDGDADSDSTVEARYKELYEGTIDIIIGTQVIAKGLDLPHLRVVGVIQADAGLSLPDFAAPERTFQLLAQVVGRVGRTNHETDVIVQSYQPTHYAVTTGLAQDYEHFYTEAIEERHRASFPPYTYLLKLTCSYKSEAAAVRQSKKLAATLRQYAPRSVIIFGPTPAFYERLRDQYRWQLTIKSSKRSDLVALLEYLPPTHWQFELDPTSLL